MTRGFGSTVLAGRGAEVLRDPIPRPVSVNATPNELRRYKADYNRGWRDSNDSADPSLDHLDAKRARDGEYDGYMDAATSRDKWHLLHCPDHDSCGRAEQWGRPTPSCARTGR